MRGLFCQMCHAKNNEEYRAVLKKRQIRLIWFILTGMATIGVSLAAHFFWEAAVSEYRLGFLLGVGTGLILGAVIGLAQIRRKLADEERLKEARLKETDEREIEVDNRALQTTAKILLAVLYGMMVLGGLFDWREVVDMCLLLIAVFLLGYTGLKGYYGKRM